MNCTKRQLISAALTEIGLAEYTFDIQPEQLNSALCRLDAMLAEWAGRGLRLGYHIPSGPSTSSIDEESGLPDYAWTAVLTNLAIQLAPSFGKQISIQTLTTARHALNTIFARLIKVNEMRLPTMPSGAGNKGLDETFLIEEESDVIERPEKSLTFR